MPSKCVNSSCDFCTDGGRASAEPMSMCCICGRGNRDLTPQERGAITSKIKKLIALGLLAAARKAVTIVGEEFRAVVGLPPEESAPEPSVDGASSASSKAPAQSSSVSPGGTKRLASEMLDQGQFGLCSEYALAVAASQTLRLKFVGHGLFFEADHILTTWL